MKKFFIALTALLLSASVTMAQAPNRLSYQSVVRNSSGALLANSQVGVRISILKTNASGAVQYAERHTPTTNANGLVDLQIGGGSVISGNFSNINWTNDAYFIKTEIDPAGGSNYSISGTSQMMSVPYALSAANGNFERSGNNISNSNTGNVGIGTASPNTKLEVQGTITAGDFGPSGSRNLMIGDDAFFTDIDINNRIGLYGITDQTRATLQLGNNAGASVTGAAGNVGIGTFAPIQRLDVNGRINVQEGVIQRGGAPITATSDMGLYSRVNANWMRFVTNAGPMKFYTREGTDGIGGTGLALDIQPLPGNLDRPWVIGTHASEPSFAVVDNFGYLGTPTNRIYRIYASAYYGTSTSIQSISDRSLKRNIQPLNKGISSLMKLRPVGYDFIPEKLFPTKEGRDKAEDKELNNQMGFIAQEVEELFPILVRDMVKEDGTVLKTVGYSGLIPVMVKGMQEQQKQIEKLEAENRELHNQLTTEMAAMKVRLQKLEQAPVKK